MIGVDVRSNLHSVIAEFRGIGEQVQEKATVRALNRALDQADTAANREIRKRYNVKAAAVRKAMKKLRASKRDLRAILQVQGSKIPLIEFSPRERKVKTARGRRRSVSVKVLVDGERKTVQGGFIGDPGKGGKRGIFKRKGKERYPIKFLQSISLPGAFSRKVVLDVVERVAAESFTTNFEQQLRFLGQRL